MIEEKSLPAQNLQTMTVPSKSAIVKATGIALVVALVILFTTVLPDEYGIDPLKTGKALGLIGLSKASDTNAGARATPAQTGIYTSQPAIYKVDSEDLVLLPGDGVEIKYRATCRRARAWFIHGRLLKKFNSNSTASRTRSRVQIILRATNWTIRSATITATVPSSRPRPGFMAGSGRTKGRRKCGFI